MQAYNCTVCGFLYDQESADKNVEGNNIPFEDLDVDWACPICGVPAEMFIPIDSERTSDLPVE